jgi:hypothetical protein
MKVYLQDKRIVRLKWWRPIADHFMLLNHIQHEVPNLLLEIEPSSPTGKREFVPAHAINLESFRLTALINLPGG